MRTNTPWLAEEGVEVEDVEFCQTDKCRISKLENILIEIFQMTRELKNNFARSLGCDYSYCTGIVATGICICVASLTTVGSTIIAIYNIAKSIMYVRNK